MNKIEIGEQRAPRKGDGERIIEFLRLMANLDLVLDTGSRTPFFDPTEYLESEAQEIDLGSQVEREWVETLSLPAQRVCRWHLKFEMLPKQIRNSLPGPTSPFQPLIDLLNSGGRFRIEDIFIDVGDMSITWRGWRNLADVSQSK